MKKEFEAGFLGVKEAVIKSRLKKLGAKKVTPKRLMRRYIFENNAMKKTHSFLRVRDEGNCITITYKTVASQPKLGGKSEIEVTVDSFTQAKELFLALGFPLTNYQESYRETWQLGQVKLEFDWWPDLPLLLEVEGVSKKSVQRVVTKLDLDITQALFGTVGHMYEKFLNRDIKKEKNLVFKKK